MYINRRINLIFVFCFIVSNAFFSEAKSQITFLKNIEFGFYKTEIEFVRFELDQEFAPNHQNYSVKIDQSHTAEIYITPELDSQTEAKILINGKKAKSGKPFKQDLDVGINPIIIEIWDEGDMGGFLPTRYTINIERTDLSTKYTSLEIYPGIWRIYDYGGFVGNESMYLVEGENKALLFDTGMGKGDLYDYVKSLTGLPVEVAITHGHFDHTGQVNDFNERTTIYMSKKDSFMLPKNLRTDNFHWIKEGDVLDLGNRKFLVIELIGHTPGSLLFFDAKNEVVITGDAVGSGSMVWMFFGDSILKPYLKGLTKVNEKFKNLTGLTILVGHSYQEKTPLEGSTGKKYFEDMEVVVKKVLLREIVGKTIFWNNKNGEMKISKAYFGLAGLWYNPDDLGIVSGKN